MMNAQDGGSAPHKHTLLHQVFRLTTFHTEKEDDINTAGAQQEGSKHAKIALYVDTCMYVGRGESYRSLPERQFLQSFQ